MTTTIAADFVLAAGASLSSVDQDGVLIEGSAWNNVTFNGLVQTSAPTDAFPIVGIRASAGGTAPDHTVTIGTTGDVEMNGTAAFGSVDGVVYGGFGSAPVTLVNQGTINVKSVGEAQGIDGGAGGGFQNHGVLTVVGQQSANGVDIEGGDFSNSGTINVTGATAAFQGASGLVIYNSDTTHEIDNSGTIHVTSLDAAVASVGIQLGGFNAVVNTGMIQADEAIVSVRDDDLLNGGGRHLDVTNSGTILGALLLNNDAGEPVTLNNSGQITGAITANNGADTLTNTGTITGQVDLGDGNDQFNGEPGTVNGDIIGGLGDDTIRGGLGTGNLDGGAGDDDLIGGPGAQALLGGDGADTLDAVYNDTQVEGGAGDDLILLNGEYVGTPLHLARLDGGDGNDKFIVYDFPGQALTIDGGTGHNTLEMHYFGTDTAPIVLHLNGDATGGAWVGLNLQTVTVVGHIANVVGGDGGQTITAPGVIDGGAGDDILTGSNAQAADPNQLLMALSGDDTIDGGAGADTINGLGGVSYLRGGDGDDSIQGGAGFDDINGNKGNDTIDGGSGGSDWLVGGQNNDSITGHTGQNLIYGNLGNDTLQGGSGPDVVRGGQGDDVLFAGSGNQFLSGDRGDDTVTAGSGHDTIHSSQDAGIDRILGYNPGHDVVELDPGTVFSVSQVGADTVITMTGSPGNNEVILVGVQMSSLTGNWIFEG